MKAILFLALPALLLTCSASAQHEEHHQPEKAAQNPMSQELAPLKGDPFSARFLKMMIAHHQSGIEMGDLVGERSESPGLKKFAGMSNRKQKQDIDKMTGWLKEWHGEAPDKDVVPKSSQEKMSNQIEALQKLKGEEFDRDFIRNMTEHHRGGIEMLALVEERTDRDPLEKFSKEGIEHQKKEIDDLEALKN